MSGADRLVHARDVLGSLYPGADIRTGGNARSEPTANERQFGVIPALSHPRVLVPKQPRGAGRAAIRAYGGRLSARDRMSYRSLGVALSLTGQRYPRPWATVGRTTDTDSCIDEHLSAIVGRPVSVAIHLTPPRANRKPVVQALAAGERFPVAFAKLATNPLTARLVGAEADALTHLGAHDWRSVVIPRVLSRQDFNGLPALVLEALPTWSAGRPPKPDEVRSAAAEIAASAPSTTCALASSPYWQQLQTQIERVAVPDLQEPLQGTAAAIVQASGGAEITFGAGHGDFTPWNMWWTRRGLLVWDWERFSTDVPVGTDLDHYRLQEMLLIDKVDHQTAARRLVAASSAPITTALYLFALAVRYDSDGQTAAGSSLPPTSQWLLPAVTASLREMTPAGGWRA